jgi:membrane-associated phospholipid phosphatase
MDLLVLDTKLFFLINQGTANSVFDVLMPFLSLKGYLLVLPYVLYILWQANRQKGNERNETMVLAISAVAVSLFSFLLTDWMANELKHIIGRTRPCNILEGVRLLVGCSASFSMPSNHSANSFAYAVPLFFMTRTFVSLRWRLYPLVLAGLVAYSRPYLGVHYPGDILAGTVIGTSAAALVILLFNYAKTKYRSLPHTTLLWGGVFVISLFRIFYILNGYLDLSPDEAHYWEWSRHLDLSYYSKGPMIAYLIAVGTSIFGDTVFGIRFFAVVLSALSSVLIYRLVNEMYADESAALWSAMIFQAVPLFAAFGIIFSIDSPFVFFWMLSLYLFYRAAGERSATDMNHEQGLSAWVLLGVSIGLGLLTKYTMAFFYPGIFLFLVMSKRRYLLKTIKPYAAVFVSLIVFSPVVIWNMQHDWVTLRHTAGQAHIAEGFVFSLRSFGEFLGSQAGIVTPVAFVLIFYTLHRLFYCAKGDRSIFLFAFSIPVIAFFLLKSIQGKVQANWAMTGYITGIIALSWYFAGSSETRRNIAGADSWKKGKAVLWTCFATALIVTMVSHYPWVIKLPPKLDPSSRLRGWHQLSGAVDPAYRLLSGFGPVFVFSDSYQISSELAFYVHGHPKAYCINLGRRMDQYDLWPGMNEDAERIRREDGAAAQPVNGIFVALGDIEMPLAVAEAFGAFEKRIVKVYDRGYELRTYSVFVCYNFKGLRTGAIETY